MHFGSIVGQRDFITHTRCFQFADVPDIDGCSRFCNRYSVATSDATMATSPVFENINPVIAEGTIETISTNDDGMAYLRAKSIQT
jgi:hypothetical protein